MKRAAGPRIALVLGSGGARGLAHIVVLETLDRLGIRPVEIAGASIGARSAVLCSFEPEVTTSATTARSTAAPISTYSGFFDRLLA